MTTDSSRRPPRRIVGLMSGTSADGIDAVVAQLEGDGPDYRAGVLAFATRPFDPALRERVFALFGPGASLDELCRLNVELGEAFARAALEVIDAAGLGPAQIDAIGCHGQTVRHLPDEPPGSTLQIGEAAVIAARTGLTTVADFRPADMAQGGQGAPLVPLADYLLFAHPQRSRALLNIGGIANITVLPAGAGPDLVAAFDLGPGNMLVDALVSRLTDGAETFDRNGQRARRGRVQQPLLEQLMDHEFLHRPPPKSTGREAFGTAFFDQLFDQMDLSPDDWAATLTAFTARSIIAGLTRFVQPHTRLDELWVAGGGARNPYLMESLQAGLPQLQLAPLDELGVSSDAREALCFAVLADQTLMRRAGNLPSATGAGGPAVLGKIVPPPTPEGVRA